MMVDGASVTVPSGDIPRASVSRLGTRAASSVPLSVAGQEKIQPHHLERLAIVYVRQSTPQQVLKHKESADLQYQLVRYATRLGWSKDRVVVIDDDQGQTASTAEGRLGFQRVLSEVGLHHVGLVLGVEMSRLARSCKDWHGLLELCALFDTLLYDHDGVYDPANYNDRLLLGLKGTLSEAELHSIKNRMEKGRKNKARRGELFNNAPRGFIKLPTGEFGVDPDEQVRGVIHLVFEKFNELGTAGKLLRWLWQHHIELPMRPHRGPQRGQLLWRRPYRTTLLEILHHPIYGGAYVYGRRPIVRRSVSGRQGKAQKLVPMDQWEVLLRDRLPAYIGWEEYLKNQEQLRQNSTHGGSGAVREGAALLAGRIVCDQCGYHMGVHYVGGRARYECHALHAQGLGPRCQTVCGAVVDEVVAEQILKALEPAAVELQLRAAENLESERRRLHKHWRQRLERASYEMERARRQYDAVEPENRLVATELEGRWEGALLAHRKLHEEYGRFQQEQPQELSAEMRQRIVALSTDIPSLWHLKTTPAADRKTIVRHLVERVEVHVQKETELVDVTIYWEGGYKSQHEVVRSVQRYEQLRDYALLKERAFQMRSCGATAAEIAKTLNREGFRTPRRGKKYNATTVRSFLSRHRLNGQRPVGKTGNEELKPDEWFQTDLARELSISARTMDRWRLRGWVHARQLTLAGRWWVVWADADELARLKRLRTCPRGQPVNRYPVELTTPRPRSQT